MKNRMRLFILAAVVSGKRDGVAGLGYNPRMEFNGQTVQLLQGHSPLPAEYRYGYEVGLLQRDANGRA